MMPVRKPKRLFKDAFGNVHLFAADSVYQIAFLNNQLELLYPTHESGISLDFLKLQIAEDHTFVFKDTYGDGQLHIYYRIDTITRKNDTLKKYDNEYIILDISNSEIHAFTVDSMDERTIPMEIPIHSKRIKYFVQDEINKKIYWVNYAGTKVKLLELDVNTGKVISELETPNLPFIENIKIRDGIVWFLYQPRLGETSRSLYQMK